MNITTLFQICVTNAIHFLFFIFGLKWRRTMEKSFVEFDVFGWREMIKNCLAIYYKHDLMFFFLLNIITLCNSKIVIFSRKLSK
jgi:hypothetical protein